MPGRNSIIASLPAPIDNTVIVEENQSVSDIMSTIAYMHKKNAKNYDKIASRFVGSSVVDTCENIFDFCKQYIPYEVETEDLQTVKSPQRILKDANDGYGHDCKHYASFIGGILDALRRQGKKINWCYRFASYRIFDTTPGHVFVVVKSKGSEIWVDPVLDSFDEKKQYSYSVDKCIQSAIGCACDSGTMGAVIGSDNKTAATLETIGGTICAVAPTVAACIPVGTVVAACVEVVGFAVGFIGKLFQGKYQYSSQVRWLCQQYQNRVLGMANITSTSNVDESYVPAAQMWFSAVLGVPVWDNLRYHALRGTTSDTDKDVNASLDQKVKWYQAFGSLEMGVPYDAIYKAAQICTQSLDDHAAPGAWLNMPPANIVLQQEGITAEQAIQQAAPVLNGSNPQALPTSTIFTSLEGSPYMVPLLIGGAALLLISTNKK